MGFLPVLRSVVTLRRIFSGSVTLEKVDALDRQLALAAEAGRRSSDIFLAAHEGEHCNSRRQWSIARQAVLHGQSTRCLTSVGWMVKLRVRRPKLESCMVSSVLAGHMP